MILLRRIADLTIMSNTLPYVPFQVYKYNFSQYLIEICCKAPFSSSIQKGMLVNYMIKHWGMIKYWGILVRWSAQEQDIIQKEFQKEFGELEVQRKIQRSIIVFNDNLRDSII